MTAFWMDTMSISDIMDELRKHQPDSTLWDLFSTYEARTVHVEPADRSPEWLQEQEKLVISIYQDYLAHRSYTQPDISDFLVAMEAYALDGDDLEDMPLAEELDKIAQQIADEVIRPLDKNEETVAQLLNALERKIVSHNKEVISASMQQEMLDNIKSMEGLDKDYKEALENNLKQMWAEQPNAYDDMPDEEEGYEPPQDYVHYQTIPLAFSDSFYGFGDAGEVDYDERDRRTTIKLDEYAEAISSALKQEVGTDLLPRPHLLDMANWSEEAWVSFDDFMQKEDAYFISDLKHVWSDGERVLVLYAEQEDKELPMTIQLRGLTRTVYDRLVSDYHRLLDEIAALRNN